MSDTCNKDESMNSLSADLSDLTYIKRHTRCSAGADLPKGDLPQQHISKMSNLLQGVIHKRNQDDNDVVVEVEVWHREQQLTQAAY